MIIEIEKLSFKISALSCFVATVTVELQLKPSTNSQLGTLVPGFWSVILFIHYFSKYVLSLLSARHMDAMGVQMPSKPGILKG